MKSLDEGTLEIQNFPLRSFVLGDRTEFDDRTGTLYVDEREALDLVREDPNILFAELKVLSLIEQLRADGFPYVVFKPGTVDQIRKVIAIAREAAPTKIIVQIEDGHAVDRKSVV